MTVRTQPTPTATRDCGDTVLIAAHRQAVRRLGHWTAARRFDVRASRGSVTLDLRSPRIDPGDIEVELDVDHAMVKLLVPDGATIDREELRRVGRCSYVDWGAQSAPSGRRIRVAGEMRKSELRINQDGIAIVSAMFTREYWNELRHVFRAAHVRTLKDLQRAHREGRWTTIDDPGRTT